MVAAHSTKSPAQYARMTLSAPTGADAASETIARPAGSRRWSERAFLSRPSRSRPPWVGSGRSMDIQDENLGPSAVVGHARSQWIRKHAPLTAERVGGDGSVRSGIPYWSVTAISIRLLATDSAVSCVRWGPLDRSPVERAQPPELGRAALRVPTPTEVRSLLTTARAADEKWGMLIALALLTGARRGELCGLRWSDVEGDTIRIRRSVYRAGEARGEKSTKGGRERSVLVGVPGTKLLKRWHTRCEKRAAELGVRLVADAFIVSSFPDGSRPVNPDSFSSAVHRICVDLDIPHVHLHSLRHFAATEMLSAGIDARNAAEILGHANPSLTLSVYAHATADRQRQAANVLGRVLAAGPSKVASSPVSSSIEPNGITAPTRRVAAKHRPAQSA